MLIDFHLGATSLVLRVKLRNSSVSTGAGLTGLTSASSGLIIAAIADNEATTTAYTVAGSLIDTIATLGTYAAPTAGHCRIKEVDPTNHKGLYEIQLENSRYAVSNAKSLTISLSGAANLAECDVCIPLRTVNPYDANFGLTNLDAAVSTRSTYAGGAVASVTAPVTTGSFSAGAITSSAFAAGATIPRVSLADVLTTNSDKTGYALTSVYDPAKVAAPATDSAAIKVVTDKLATMLQASGLNWQYTIDALAEAPAGGGGGITITDVQTAMTNQGYTTTRAPKLDNLDAAVSTRSTYAGGAVASVTAPVTAGTVSDKTGYSLSGTQSFNNTGQTSNIPTDIQTIKTQTVTCGASVTIYAHVGAAAAPGTQNGVPILPSTLVLAANVTKWGGQGSGIAVDANTNRPLVNIVGSAATLATSNGLERLAWLLSPNDGSSLDDGVVLPDQTGMTTTQVKLSASANSANVRVGYVLTMKSGTQINKGRHITGFDGTTKIITINTAWTTNPAAGDTFRVDPPPKANVAGYNNLQDPASLLLVNPANLIATDASHNVTIDPTAILAGIWPDGPPTILDGVVQANVIDINNVPVTIEDIIADVVTALTNYGAAKTTDLSAISAVTAKLATMLQAVGGNWQFTIQALAQAPAGGGGGGLLGTTPLTFATQIGNTTPTVMAALSMVWAAFAGSFQANATDATKTDLLAPDGTTVLFTYDAPTRVQLTADALDLIMAETTAGINMRQAVQLILAMAVGQLAGAGTGTLSITGANVAIERVRCVGDSLGNRTQVTITFDN